MKKNTNNTEIHDPIIEDMVRVGSLIEPPFQMEVQKFYPKRIKRIHGIKYEYVTSSRN